MTFVRSDQNLLQRFGKDGRLEGCHTSREVCILPSTKEACLDITSKRFLKQKIWCLGLKSDKCRYSSTETNCF